MGQKFSLQCCLTTLFPCCFPDEEDLKGKKLKEIPDIKELGVKEPIPICDEDPSVRMESSSNIMVAKVTSDEPSPVVEVVAVKVINPETLKEPEPIIEGGPGTYPDENGSFDHDTEKNEEKDWVSITDEEISQASRNRANTD